MEYSNRFQCCTQVLRHISFHIFLVKTNTNSRWPSHSKRYWQVYWSLIAKLWLHHGKEIDWEPEPPNYSEFRHVLQHPLVPWSMIVQIAAHAAAFLLLLLKVAMETWAYSGHMITLCLILAQMAICHVLKPWSWDSVSVPQFNVYNKVAIKLLTFPGMDRLRCMLYFNCKAWCRAHWA